MELSKHQPGRGRSRGIALLLVLSVVVVLAIVVVDLWQASQPSWDENTLSRGRFQAGLLAESGANIASHPNIEPGDVALQQDFGYGRTVETRITTENGRILINNLTQDSMIEAVTELFILWGVEAANAAIAADSIADWLDSNSDPRTNGAENSFYSQFNFPEFPSNQAFTSLEQLLFVRGMDKIAKIQPQWRDYFTLYGDGLIDVNSAPAETIQAVFGVTADSAANLVATRDGEDGITGTVDDYRFDEAGELQAVLGLSSQEWNEISSLVTFNGSIRRIESVGQVGDFRVKRVLLVEVTGEGRNETVTPVARFAE